LKHIVLLLIIVCSIATGYFIGDYRGRKAREALQQAIQTGKTLLQEHEKTISELQRDLGDINTRYKHELDASRKDFEASALEWEKVKTGLQGSIRQQTVRLDKFNGDIGILMAKIAASTGNKKETLENELARQQKELGDVTRERNGNICLATLVPQSVVNALGSTAVAEKGK
jgi:hypothetical protein